MSLASLAAASLVGKKIDTPIPQACADEIKQAWLHSTATVYYFPIQYMRLSLDEAAQIQTAINRQIDYLTEMIHEPRRSSKLAYLKSIQLNIPVPDGYKFSEEINDTFECQNDDEEVPDENVFPNWNGIHNLYVEQFRILSEHVNIKKGDIIYFECKWAKYITNMRVVDFDPFANVLCLNRMNRANVIVDFPPGYYRHVKTNHFTFHIDMMNTLLVDNLEFKEGVDGDYAESHIIHDGIEYTIFFPNASEKRNRKVTLMNNRRITTNIRDVPSNYEEIIQHMKANNYTTIVCVRID